MHFVMIAASARLCWYQSTKMLTIF